MDTLVSVMAQAVPVTLGMLAAGGAFGRRIAGISALRFTQHFPHPGVPRLWGVAGGSLLLLVLMVGLGAKQVAGPAVLTLAVLGTVPFGFARANVFLLMRRERGRIKSGDDWKAARRGESLGFASLGVFTAAELWPIPAGRRRSQLRASSPGWLSSLCGGPRRRPPTRSPAPRERGHYSPWQSVWSAHPAGCSGPIDCPRGSV